MIAERNKPSPCSFVISPDDIALALFTALVKPFSDLGNTSSRIFLALSTSLSPKICFAPISRTLAKKYPILSAIFVVCSQISFIKDTSSFS